MIGCDDGTRPARRRTCFVHGGSHKTGTSAIQQFLIDNRDGLMARGYLVPQAGMSPSGAHHHLVRAIAGLSVGRLFKNCVEELQTEMAESDCENIVISSEEIESLLLRDKTFSGIFDVISSSGCEIVYVHYVRHPPQLINSQYTQRIKAYQIDYSFAEYVGRILKRGGYLPVTIVDGLDEQKIERIIRPYNQHVRSAGTVRDFLDVIGLSDFETNWPETRTNELIGPVTVEVARQSMQRIPGGVRQLSFGQNIGCGQALKEAIKKAGLREPAYCGLTTEVAKRIEKFHEAACDAFAFRVWGKRWTDNFADDIGCTYTPNDFAYSEPGPEQRRVVSDLLDRLNPVISEIIVARGDARGGGGQQTRAEEMASFTRRT